MNLAKHLKELFGKAKPVNATGDSDAVQATTNPHNTMGKTGQDHNKTWDQMARTSALYAIYATEDQQKFERGGIEDAQLIAQWVTSDSIVLDVGCGIGRIEKYLAPYCRELHSVDVSREMLAQARARLAGIPNVHLHHTTATDLSCLGTETVDLAFSLLVLQHIEKEDAYLALREIHRVLRPGGIAYLQFPNLFADIYFRVFVEAAEMETRPVHRMRLYTPAEAVFLLEKVGFRIEQRLGDAVEILLLASKATS